MTALCYSALGVEQRDRITQVTAIQEDYGLKFRDFPKLTAMGGDRPIQVTAKTGFTVW